jgi:hypothetical protein
MIVERWAGACSRRKKGFMPIKRRESPRPTRDDSTALCLKQFVVGLCLLFTVLPLLHWHCMLCIVWVLLIKSVSGKIIAKVKTLTILQSNSNLLNKK